MIGFAHFEGEYDHIGLFSLGKLTINLVDAHHFWDEMHKRCA